jgi:replicative DNA helicase
MKLDLDFLEYVILDNCFKNASYLSTIVDIATPKYFGNPDCRKIYGLLSLFYSKRGRLPTDIELQSYMANDHLKLALKNVQSEMSHFSGNYNDDELIENTEMFLKERGLAITLEELVENYEKIDLNVQSAEILDKFTKVCNINLNTNLGLDYFEEIEEFAETLANDDDHISTGFGWLDKKLSGGYKKNGKALYVFSGAPNSGKSIILGNTVVSLLKQNKNVILITLEMSEQVYAQRISSQLSRIPMHNLKSSKETLIQYCNDFTKDHTVNLIIKEFPNNTVKASGIENFVNDVIKRKRVKPDAIVIDYLNLVAPKQHTGNLYQDVKSICEDIRRLSYVFKCPVISATQLGRTAIGKENPGLETTSESIGTAATADVQIAIYSNESDREIGMVYLGIQRNRYGANFGTKALKVDWDTLYLEQFEDDDDDSSDIPDDMVSDAEGSLKNFQII